MARDGTLNARGVRGYDDLKFSRGTLLDYLPTRFLEANPSIRTKHGVGNIGRIRDNMDADGERERREKREARLEKGRNVRRDDKRKGSGEEVRERKRESERVYP